MIDFDAAVLGPCMDTFARPAIFTPLVSNPDAEPFVGRGVWALKSADYLSETGSMLAVDEWTLGVSSRDFVLPMVPPVPGDQVLLPAHLSLPALGPCVIDDDRYDGQGGYRLVLKLINP